MAQYFIQMSGVPGSGKSAIAQRIGERLNAVVLDHDESKSALMSSGIDEPVAGRGSYETLKVLSGKIIAQGHSVIFDSPCQYLELLRHGQELAEKYRVAYRYIECRLDDEELLQQRLMQRNKQPSQVRSLDTVITRQDKQWTAREIFQHWAANMKRPEQGYLVIDTTLPLDICIKNAIRYIEEGKPAT